MRIPFLFLASASQKRMAHVAPNLSCAMFFAFLWLTAVGGSPCRGASANPAASATAESEGRALAAHLIGPEQKPPENFTASGLLTSRDRSGKRSDFPVTFQILVSPTNWIASYEVQMNNPPQSVKLAVIHFDNGGSNEYWLAQSTPAARETKPVRLRPDQTVAPLAGSDFWLFDLGLEFFYWPDQRLAKKEMRRGRSCRVLESRNPHPTPEGYSRVLSWIDLETSSLIRAEAYDRQNRLLKEFHPGAIAKVNGRTQLKEMEIRNLQTGSKTQIEFNFE
jgi:hypothetical protein